jgi:hypothetical protein
MNGDVFLKITNQNIYDEIKELHLKVEKMQSEITKRQDITNGKVKKNNWIATTAMSLTVLLLGLLFEHLGRS